jgi:hypothetical protein
MSCKNQVADITSYNMDTGTGNYFGSSTRQAALATGQINQFATDTVNFIPTNLGGSTDGIDANRPSGLAFANTSANTTIYGGNYLGTFGKNWCVPDYAASVTGTTGTAMPNFNTLPPYVNNVYRLSGDQSFSNIKLKAGVHVTLIVTGNVLLNNDVTYDTYASVNDIPQFTLISLGGDIYIHHDVSELHGFYVAQPVGGANGTIYTCATGSGSPVDDYANCNNPLTIYGSVAANKIVPGRTVGNVAQTSAAVDLPAEQFVYTPELWLGSTTAPTTSCAIDPTQANCMYQSFTSLPPVL